MSRSSDINVGRHPGPNGSYFGAAPPIETSVAGRTNFVLYVRPSDTGTTPDSSWSISVARNSLLATSIW